MTEEDKHYEELQKQCREAQMPTGRDVSDSLDSLVECPWCPDAGEVASRDETLHGHPAKRASCGLCGVAGPFGQTDQEALDYFQQAFNDGVSRAV